MLTNKKYNNIEENINQLKKENKELINKLMYHYKYEKEILKKQIVELQKKIKI